MIPITTKVIKTSDNVNETFLREKEFLKFSLFLPPPVAFYCFIHSYSPFLVHIIINAYILANVKKYLF